MRKSAGFPSAGVAESVDVRAFAAFFVSAGLVNATIAALLVCRLPESRLPSASSLMLRAAVYVLVGAGAGIAGAYFYWRRASNSYRLASPIAFREFALICAAGWVWVPSAVLLSTADSSATALIGALCGGLVGAGLRAGIVTDRNPDESSAGVVPARENELFAAALERVPREGIGYFIAGCVYAAGYAQYDHARLLAGLLSAAAAFAFAWTWKQPSPKPVGRIRRDVGRRLAWTGPLAILFTGWALLLGIAHRNAPGDAALAAAADADNQNAQRRPGEQGAGPGGFESVILWPLPPKKQLVPPIPKPANYLGLEKSRPLVIRFDGAYWYFQPPETEPGRTAHQAHGTPLNVNIQSVNSFPLMMEAHQRLVGPVRLARCREIDVEIENRDNLPGALSLAVMLRDSEFPKRPGVYLGKREIETSLAGLFSYKPSPTREMLRFAIPAAGPIRKFDEITVMLMPEVEHSMVAPKIAVAQFELFPR
jgi:hypothetical protein